MISIEESTMKLTEEHKLFLMWVLQDSLRVKDTKEANPMMKFKERNKLYREILKFNESKSNE